MVEIADVRNFLNNISSSRVPDDTITEQIEVANTKVQAEKSMAATEEQIRDATLVYAAYLTMVSYASQYERSVGALPSSIKDHVALLQTLAEGMLQYIRRANLNLVPLVAQPETLGKQYTAGDLQEDLY